MLRKYIMKLYKSLYYSDLYNSTIFIDSNVRFHNVLSIILIATCLLINLCINVVRFLQLYESHVTIINILYFNYMYFSSIQVYITELQFLILAYGLYIRFQVLVLVEVGSVLKSTKLGPVPNASSVMDAYSLNLKCNTVSNLVDPY
ncbi:uncharacterized protein LOC113471495 [Diaphorina citri]|uniref:Uncharacterized protein LOC113471495 n=1 Tax=Diaphorina citri TaxID=121845 RepID=A0A3Q0JID8_DIACI|nr:uncharacterized protein LOC113471495 [Diaphorina citri]